MVLSQAQRKRFRSELRAHVPVLVLGDLDPHAISTREVLDPIERNEEYFSAVYGRIERCAGRLAELLGSARRV